MKAVRRNSYFIPLLGLCLLPLMPNLLSQPHADVAETVMQEHLEKQFESIGAACREGSAESFHFLAAQTGEDWFLGFLRDRSFDPLSVFEDNGWDHADVAAELVGCIGAFRGHEGARTAFALAWSRAPNPFCREMAIRTLSRVADLGNAPSLVTQLGTLGHDPVLSVRRVLACTRILSGGAPSRQASNPQPAKGLVDVYLGLLADEDPVVRFEAARQLSVYGGTAGSARRTMLALLSCPEAARHKVKPGAPLDWGAQVSVRTAAAIVLGRMKTGSGVIVAALPETPTKRQHDSEHMLFMGAVGNSLALAGEPDGFRHISRLADEKSLAPYGAVLAEEWDLRHLRIALAYLTTESPGIASVVRGILLPEQENR